MSYAHGVGASAPPAVPVRRYWIPGGDLGTFATLLYMRSAARMGAMNPQVQRTARQLCGSTPEQFGDTLRAYLAAHTRFQPDPVALELIRTPVEQLATIDRQGSMPGDCDDVATLGAALAKAVGVRARFVVLGFSSPSAPFRHVYAEVCGPRGWRDLDVTRKPTSARPLRRAVLEV